ncbi:hypothetical protein QBC43DRAFT_312652 [Cladorrhinum sp. PSN259]|nr:hypothetical protein QBC43DRAFT_312652 [Cladorrhinum sp. PSN259]
MGSAVSRCNGRHSGTTTGLSEIGQKILDRQPNWLVTPSKWRSHHSEHHPVRYRTPTPYPKDHRKRLLDDSIENGNEKILIIETPTVHHVDVAAAPHSQHIKFPSSTITITWESHPRRLNRFERPS